jgi:hypothetical protein
VLLHGKRRTGILGYLPNAHTQPTDGPSAHTAVLILLKRY